MRPMASIISFTNHVFRWRTNRLPAAYLSCVLEIKYGLCVIHTLLSQKFEWMPNHLKIRGIWVRVTTNSIKCPDAFLAGVFAASKRLRLFSVVYLDRFPLAQWWWSHKCTVHSYSTGRASFFSQRTSGSMFRKKHSLLLNLMVISN